MSRPAAATTEFAAALRGTLQEPRHVALAALIAAATYVLIILSSFPGYSLQLLRASVFYLDDAVLALTQNLHATTGVAGLLAITIYAVFTGVAVVHVLIQAQLVGGLSLLRAGGTAPFVLIGGCAGCGAGLLGVLGFAGALTMLPFGGNGVRWLGVLLFGYFLARAGDPWTCRLEQDG